MSRFQLIKMNLNNCLLLRHPCGSHGYQVVVLLPPARFLKTAGTIVFGVRRVSAVSAVSEDVLLYISVAVKASFLKLGMCNICKNNIAKMFLDFF